MDLRSISRAALLTAIPVFAVATMAVAGPGGYDQEGFGPDAHPGPPPGLLVSLQAIAAASDSGETALAGQGLTLRDGSQASFLVASAAAGKISTWNGLLLDGVPFTIPTVINTGLDAMGESAPTSKDDNSRADGLSGTF